jgi:hypothetical protein
MEAMKTNHDGGGRMDEKQDMPAILLEKREQWLVLLKDDLPVKDRFRLRDKTVAVKLKPGDVANEAKLAEQLDVFVGRLNDVSVQIEGSSPANPVGVELDPNQQPREFHVDAYLLSDGVEGPPNDDDWV